jgi:dienelactone hydrolase
MRTQSPGSSYLALPHGTGPHPGVVVVHEASGLNDNIRDICGRFAAEGYAALGVDLFEGRNRAVCRVLETELTVAGVPHDLKVYPGAKHAFFNDQWRSFHPDAAADSWQRVLAFFAEHVRRSPTRPT